MTGVYNCVPNNNRGKRRRRQRRNLHFRETGELFSIKDNCNPDGGQFIRNDRFLNEWHTIRLATRILIGDKRLCECEDIWQLWGYNDKSLREMYNFEIESQQ